jgi:hypothetical protein
MSMRLLQLLVASWIALLAGPAHAKPRMAIDPKTLGAGPIEVYVVGGEVWSIESPYRPGTSDPIYEYSEFYDGVISRVCWVVKCPLVGETVTELMLHSSATGTTLPPPGPDTDKGEARVVQDVLIASTDDILASCGKTVHTELTLRAACDPLVGKPDPHKILLNIQTHVRCEPDKLPAAIDLSPVEHECPAGYEIDDASPHGEGVQSAMLSTPFPAQCRKVDPSKVVKTSPAKPPKKSAEQVAEAKFQQTLELGRDAQAVFNLAGYVTIHELANAPLAHLTSVLGIAGGKKVSAAAKKAVASASVVDPNWIFDEYFLIRPTWFLDPRLRMTSTSLAKLKTAQDQLSKLQKAGIVTLYQLSQSSPSTVAAKLGATPAAATALIGEAKAASAYNGNAADMAIQRDWVIHPAWMVDPGLLPSAKVVRRQEQQLAGKSTTAPSAATASKIPTADTHPVDPSKAMPDRKLPGVDPATGLDPKGPAPRGVGPGGRKAPTTPRTGPKSAGGRSGRPQSRGGSGGGGIPRAGEGGRGGGR